MKSVACCVVTCLSLAAFAAAKKLPSYVKACAVTDPAYDACVLRTVEALRPRLAKGIPMLRIPPLEPFTIQALSLTQDTEMFRLSGSWKDMHLFGCSHFLIEDIKSDPLALTTEITLLLPALANDGAYDTDIRLLQVSFKEKGTFRANFTNIRSKASVQLKMTTVAGTKRLSVAKLRIRTRIHGEADVKLSGLPGADKEHSSITDATNALLNNNQKQLYEFVYPFLDEFTELALTPIIDDILSNLDVDELLPAE